MKFIANLMDPIVDPGQWAREREAEGWPVLAASDHLFIPVGGKRNEWFPHLWVTVSQMAAATSRARITSTFANNLLRSPVEFVQASLTMQRVSGGRWEALGAGWSRPEMDAAGMRFPEPRERADRYIEAVRIARQLIDLRKCSFAGEYYTVEIPPIPGFDDVPSPSLVGALGGPRTIAGAGPLLDRIEIKASSPATRSGKMDSHTFAQIPRSHLTELIEKVRRAAPNAEIAFYARCGVHDDPLARELSGICTEPNGLYTGLFGPAEEVAERLGAFAEFGVSHVNISPTSPRAFGQLAPYLFG